jgi:nucleotide-binding universal stress UspA family protein
VSTEELPKRIMVGTDGSETAARAVSKATSIAKALGADLIVVSAYSRRAPGLSPGVEDTWAAEASLAAEERVNQAAEQAKAAGVENAWGRTLAGDPADALVDEAERAGVDLLVVGSKGMQSSSRFLLGNVPNKVSHHSPCDILIVHTAN